MLTRRQKHAEVAALSSVQANGVWGALPADVLLQILDAVVALLAPLRQQADPFALKVGRQIGSAMRQCAVGINAQPCTHQGCLPAETGFCNHATGYCTEQAPGLAPACQPHVERTGGVTPCIFQVRPGTTG